MQPPKPLGTTRSWVALRLVDTAQTSQGFCLLPSSSSAINPLDSKPGEPRCTAEPLDRGWRRGPFPEVGCGDGSFQISRPEDSALGCSGCASSSAWPRPASSKRHHRWSLPASALRPSTLLAWFPSQLRLQGWTLAPVPEPHHHSRQESLRFSFFPILSGSTSDLQCPVSFRTLCWPPVQTHTHTPVLPRTLCLVSLRASVQ